MSSLGPWQDIRRRITAAQLVPDTHINWPNEPFRLPVGELWLTVEATGSSNYPIEIGAGCYLEEGQAYFHVFAPAGTGSEDARQIAENAFAVFRGVNGPVVYTGGSIGSGEAADIEGNWWRLTVTIDWRYQTIITA